MLRYGGKSNSAGSCVSAGHSGSVMPVTTALSGGASTIIMSSSSPAAWWNEQPSTKAETSASHLTAPAYITVGAYSWVSERAGGASMIATAWRVASCGGRRPAGV